MKNKKNDKFKMQLQKSISNYGKDNVDIIVDCLYGKMYGCYHSKSDSFSTTEDYPMDIELASRLSEELDIGYSEIG